LEKAHYSAIVLLALTAFVAALLLKGVQVSWGWLGAVSAATSAVGLGIFLFDHYLWRVGWLYGKFHKRPNIAGVWDVTFRSTFDDGSGNPVLRSGSMRVDQTFFNLDIFVETEESEGVVVSREFVKLGKDRPRLCATYRNEPRANFRARSQMHYGTLLVSFDEPARRPERLAGNYWTDRETRGELEAVRRS
jgi:hypothetical protein